MNELQDIANRFKKNAPAVDYWSLRLEDHRYEGICVRQAVLEPLQTQLSRGALITVAHGGGIGYAATNDVSSTGLREASKRAMAWAKNSAKLNLLADIEMPFSSEHADYHTPIEQAWDSSTLGDKIELLQNQCAALKIDDRIVDWISYLGFDHIDSLQLNSHNGRIEQSFQIITPQLIAVANQGSQTQRRTNGAGCSARQGGLEQLEATGFSTQAQQIAEQAIALLDAPECPSGNLDLLLMPDQMVLQIHESIGHPLELDRILGDERNYAGTSFVTQDMFGSYQYGSDKLNVTFDPSRWFQLASYAYDDEGSKAERTFIIKDGVLLTPLGGALSQQRAGMSGVANSRACAWNRPPIDRMANLNVEAGESSLAQMIASIENGVLMETNRSWSIDDSRNKFQFGCELGREIKDGELKGIVRNPNYRGISATFWRNLKQVGNEDTFQVLGVSNCGKGEPNQVIRVGHASPACLFQGVDLFGGQA
ncbi:TldD/PmbA family protein [Kaarinaea lacus]